ncbi:MAG: ExeA family protein [Planctomycetaceae bacterium]
MYENYFHLSQRPFAAAPQVEAYVSTPFCENALQSSIRCLERAEGIALIMGPTGTGKSLLCQLVARHFADRFEVALLDSARLCTRRALLQNILFTLRLPYRNMDEGELRLALMSHLDPQTSSSQGLVLIVDEAHTLPPRLLEEVRLITNLVRGGQPRIRLLLAGGMAMEERLASPKLEAFQQRLATRSYLQAFNYDETIHYISQQLRRCGGDPQRCISGDAMEAIYRVTDGVPRLVNQLSDHALLLAANGHRPLVDRNIVEDAWADLQQLPGPWHADHPQAGKPVDGGVVEFGSLADEASFTVEFDHFEPAQSAVVESDFASATTASIETVPSLPNLEARYAELREEWPFPSMSTVSPVSSPISTTPIAVNPFGDGFDQEEVVLDRYAGMASALFENAPRVSSEEGKSIGKQLASIVAPITSYEMPEPTGDLAESVEPQLSLYSHEEETVVGDDSVETAFYSAEPEVVDAIVPEPVVASLERPGVRTYRPFSFGEGIDDDRDMIVVSEQEMHQTATLESEIHGRRRGYRQLFSSLRRGT